MRPGKIMPAHNLSGVEQRNDILSTIRRQNRELCPAALSELANLVTVRTNPVLVSNETKWSEVDQEGVEKLVI